MTRMRIVPSSERSHALRSSLAAALVAALLAASAWVALPLPFVPVTLQVFAVVLAALLLAPRWAAASVGSYVLLGAVGVPVFAGPAGGLGVIAGPTGGYLIGFLLGASAGASVRSVIARGVDRPASDLAAAAVTIGCIYLLGWLQLSVVAGIPLPTAFAVGVVPFVPVDMAKAAAAVAVAAAVRRAGIGPSTALAGKEGT